MRNQTSIALLFIGLLVFGLSLFHQFLGLKALTISLLLVVGVIIIASPTRWSIRILFFYLGFEGLAKIVSNYNPVIHVGGDLLVVALVSKTLFLMTLGRIKQTEPLPPLSNLIFVHFAWFIITIANPYSLGIVPSLAAAKIYVTMVMLYFFAFYLFKDRREIKIIMGIWVLVTTIHCLTGLYQASVGPQSVLQIHPGYASILKKYGSYAFRPVGLSNLPGNPAIFVFLSISFLLYFAFSAKKIAMKVLLFGMTPIWIILSLLCQIRSALLKTIVAASILIGFYFLQNLGQMSAKSLQKLGIATLALLTLFFAVPSFIKSAESTLPDAARAFERSFTLFDIDKVKKARKNTGKRLWKYAMKAPLGAGLSRTGAASGKFKHLINSPDDPFGNYFFADNFWIATVVDLGIPGMFILTLIIFSIILRGFLMCRTLWPTEDQLLHVALLAGLFASVVGMYGAEAMLYNPEAAYFWFFAGALVRMQTNSQELKQEYLEKQRSQNELADLAHRHL